MKATEQFFDVMLISRYFSTRVIDFGAFVIETGKPWSGFHLSVVKQNESNHPTNQNKHKTQ